MSHTSSLLHGRPGGRKRSRPSVKKQDLPAELARLETLTLPELKAKWVELYGKPLKGARKGFLIRGIAYRLQELVYGGLSAKTRRRLKQLAKQFARDPDHRPAVAPDLKPGCRLLREWRGVMHEVVVLDKGFRYRDQTYRTLSEIARLVTGARWSGPVFFGVRKVVAAGRAKGGAAGRAIGSQGGQAIEPARAENSRRRAGLKPAPGESLESSGDAG